MGALRKRRGVRITGRRRGERLEGQRLARLDPMVNIDIRSFSGRM